MSLFQEKMVQSHTQRLQLVKPVVMDLHIRPAPPQSWRCWVAFLWFCVSPRPGWVQRKWSSWHTSPFPVPFSSPGSAPTGTSSPLPSTTLGMWPQPERSRRPFKNSGEVKINQSGELGYRTLIENVHVGCLQRKAITFSRAGNVVGCLERKACLLGSFWSEQHLSPSYGRWLTTCTSWRWEN